MPGSTVTVVIGALAWSNWTRVELEAAYLAPADSWSVSAANPTPAQLQALSIGQAVQVLVNGKLALRGTLETIESERSKDAGVVLELGGRDQAAALVDCMPSPGSRTWSSLSLAAVAQKWMTELGIVGTVSAAAPAMQVQERIIARPGETYWACLKRYCQKLRLMPWMSPAGVLELSRPDYNSQPVGLLLHALDSRRNANNVLEARYRQDLSRRFSQLTVLGQYSSGGSSLFSPSSGTVKGTAYDLELQALGIQRPGVLDVGQCSGSVQARDRAQWEISKRQHDGRRLSYVVNGLGPKPGELWSPNTQVLVDDQFHSLSGPWWITSRRLLQDGSGSRTVLELREPHTLLPAVA